jgi:uracil-DNA glycosylase
LAKRAAKAPKPSGSATKVAEPDRNCPLCPRLAAFRADARAREPEWHNAPVLSFGSARAPLLVVGLAPGLRGANRTGRPFTGDWAGDLLYATLLEFGFARGVYDERPDDGLTLVNYIITNTIQYINTCRPFLTNAIDAGEARAVVALGRIAHDSVLRALGARLAAFPFAHGAQHDVTSPAGRALRIFDSYHCSRYNTNTGVLTEDMFRDVFRAVRGFVDPQSP